MEKKKTNKQKKKGLLKLFNTFRVPSHFQLHDQLWDYHEDAALISVQDIYEKDSKVIYGIDSFKQFKILPIC